MITFDGRVIEARVGMTVAAALTEAGIAAFRRTRRGAPRGLFCGMGACQDCLVEIDGEANRPACMVRIDAPLAVRSQSFPPRLAAGDDEPGPIGAPQDVEILVVGGGAGGLTAAAVAAEAGAQVVLVDERPALGGQYYKQQVGSTLPQDRQFAAGRRLIERTREAGVAFVEGAVWSASSLPLEIAVVGPQGAHTFRPSRLIVATGAIERPAPVPGWTLPGVMTTGAAQTLLRSYGVPAGRRVVVAGNGPLNLQLACELQEAGARVVAVAEAARRPGMWAARQFATMAAAAPDLLLRGAGYLRELRLAGVPIHWGAWLAAAEPSPSGLVAHLSNGAGIEADAVAMGYGFLPANDLLRLLSCRHRYDPGRDQLVTERDADCRTTLPGVLAVGDCCGLGGARAAEAEGAIAGAVAVGKPGSRGVARARSALARQRRFQAGLWRLFAAPRRGLEFADPQTVVCRCEEVTLAEIDAAMADGAASPSAVKRATRAGMGRCQGRYCGPLLAALLHQRTGRPLDELSFFAPRPPIKPVPLATVAGLESTCPSLP